jgi:hypothetical protein
MKIIFSRKGFDSGSGGSPSPIFSDGRMLSLPIPDKKSVIAYEDIVWDNYNVGEIVESMTKGKIASNYRAHLDPDINKASISRHKDWQPVFGQVGGSQGHLSKQGVGAGDLFLFFGLFQDVIVENGKVNLNSKSSPKHIIWGWFQVETSIAVDKIDRSKFEWAIYHPHFHRKPEKSNTIYFATKVLDIPGLDGENISGAGIFPRFLNKLQLTASASRPSVWKLPLWMFPTNEASALSYHRNLERWKKRDGYALLQTVGRGQEFVFNNLHHPEAMQWVSSLFAK